MKLFSKRNPINLYRDSDQVYGRGYSSRRPLFKKSKFELIESEVRIRLSALVGFISSSNDYLEKCILVKNESKDNHYLNQTILNDFSKSELGYNFSDFFKLNPFEIKSEQISDDVNERMVDIYNDYYLFDLLETVILFSKENKRAEVIKRINTIFSEEVCDFEIKENIITRHGGEDLETISNQLSDDKLKSKIRSYYDFFKKDDYVNSSKLSSEIINMVYSDDSSPKTKTKTINEIYSKIIDSVVVNKKEKEKRKEELLSILIDNSKHCNKLNNRVYDIRHSEKDRIKVSNLFLYKMISVQNMAMVELTITSLKDSYISEEDWETIKSSYIDKYKIDKDTYYSPDLSEDSVYNSEEDDIPF